MELLAKQKAPTELLAEQKASPLFPTVALLNSLPR